MLRHLLLLPLISLLCLSCRQQSRLNEPPTLPGSVTHVVIFYLKSPGDPAARNQIIRASHAFRSIPGVLSVQAGPVLPSLRPVVDSTYDVGVVITFKDDEAMRAYDQHPIHQQAVNGVLKELVARVVIYDFTNR